MLYVEFATRLGSFHLDVKFSAPTPSVIALFGPSGCGKTSIINAVAGLLRPERGRVEIDGEVLCDTAVGRWLPAEHRRVGYVFQDSRLFPHLTVRRNLEYGQRRNRTAPVRSGFDDVIALLGLEPLLARRPATLSGGERQRVALGRALLTQPRLLLLDEPLASLDAARRDEVLPYLELLRDRWRIPMLYVSHQFDEVVRLATHVVVLNNGHAVAAGTLSEVALEPALASVAGKGAIGAVVDGRVTGVDADGLATVTAGGGTLRVPGENLAVGAPLRLRVLASDVILATRPPDGISVRNILQGRVTAVQAESVYSDIVSVDVGGATFVSRVTSVATRELGLARDRAVWVLIKAVSLRIVDTEFGQPAAL